MILEFIKTGGIFMWPLIISAILAFYFICSKAIQLAVLYAKCKARTKITTIRELLKDNKLAEAKALLGSKTPIDRLLSTGITYIEKGYDENAAKDRLEMLYDDDYYQLEKGLSVLLVLGEIMPMLGLLGTVSGMIQVFKAISVYGTGDANALASGISEALITTETGLILAIPILFIYTLLGNQVEKYSKLMRQAGASIITSIRVINKRKNNV